MKYPVEPNQKQEMLLEIDKQFIEDRLTLNAYLKGRSVGGNEYWSEIPFLARNMVYLNRLLIKLPPPLRLQATMGLNQLVFDDIKRMGFGGSISDFFQYSPNIQPKEPTCRYFQMAPILDIPIEYMTYPIIDFQEVSFLEYRLCNSSCITIDEAFNLAKEKPDSRRIDGKIVQNYFIKEKIFKSEGEFLFLRIDRRTSFFSLEFYIRSSKIEIMSIEKLVKTFLGENNIYTFICDPILRDHKKLVIIAAYEFNRKTLDNYVNFFKDRFRSQRIIPM